MPEQSRAEFLPRMLELLEQGKSVQIKPSGISMRPTLRPDKDIVILSPLPEALKKFDVVFYRRADGQCVLHRIVAVGERYTCLGDNQFRVEPGVAREQMIAVMTGFIRDGKEYSAEDLRYRIYCRLRYVARKIRHVCMFPKYYIRRVLLCLKLKP